MSRYDWSRCTLGDDRPPFVRFNELGASIAGDVIKIEDRELDPTKPPTCCIDIRNRDGDTYTLTVDRVDLARKLKALDVQEGDKLAVKYVDNEKTPSGTKKLFAVRHEAAHRPADEEDPF